MGFERQKNTPFTVVDTLGPDVTFAERTRKNDIANAWRAQWVAGSRMGIIEGTGVQDADNYLDFRIDGDAAGGYTYQVIAEVLTFDAGTTIEPQVYDVTIPSAPVLVATGGGSPSASLTWSRQILLLGALPATVNFYRVRCNKVGAANARMIAYLETVG